MLNGIIIWKWLDLDSTKNPNYDKPLGIVDVIVGPTFDARAYLYYFSKYNYSFNNQFEKE